MNYELRRRIITYLRDKMKIFQTALIVPLVKGDELIGERDVSSFEIGDRLNNLPSTEIF
jgi:hypothetical protein